MSNDLFRSFFFFKEWVEEQCHPPVCLSQGPSANGIDNGADRGSLAACRVGWDYFQDGLRFVQQLVELLYVIFFALDDFFHFQLELVIVGRGRQNLLSLQVFLFLLYDLFLELIKLVLDVIDFLVKGVHVG